MPGDDKDVVLPKFMVGTVRGLILRSGAALVDDKKAADIILQSCLGAQSADHRSFLIGIPSFTIPAPLAGPLTTRKLVALFKHDLQRGLCGDDVQREDGYADPLDWARAGDHLERPEHPTGAERHGGTGALKKRSIFQLM